MTLSSRRDAEFLYSKLDDPLNRGSFSGEIARHADSLRPERLVVLEPGDYRVRHALEATARSIGVALDIRPDQNFLCTPDTRPTVWRWQQRFAENGVEGLLRDKTRKPGRRRSRQKPRRR